MAETALLTGSTVSQKAPKTPAEILTPGTSDYFRRQLDKFFSKEFKYIFDTREVPFIRVETTRFRQVLTAIGHFFTSHVTNQISLDTKEGFEDFLAVFPPINKAPRQSLTMLFGRDKLVMRVTFLKNLPVYVQIGTYVGNEFLGVQVNL